MMKQAIINALSSEYRQPEICKLGHGMNITGFRSAAPISIPSLKDLPELFQHFWKHGVTGEDRAPEGAKSHCTITE